MATIPICTDKAYMQAILDKIDFESPMTPAPDYRPSKASTRLLQFAAEMNAEVLFALDAHEARPESGERNENGKNTSNPNVGVRLQMTDAYKQLRSLPQIQT